MTSLQTATSFTKALQVNIRSFVRSLRLHNTRLLIIFLLIGLKLSNIPYFTFNTLLLIIILMSTYGFGSVANYFSDISIDHANKRFNPFSDNNATNNYKAILYGLLLVSLCIPLITDSVGFNLMIAITMIFSGITYSHHSFKWSHHPVGKITIMILIYCLLPGLMGLGQFADSADIKVILALSLLAGSWLLYSDIKDIKGDLLHHKRTIANSIGVQRTALISAMTSLIAVYLMSKSLQANSIFDHRITTALLSVLIANQLIAVYKCKILLHRLYRLMFGYLSLFFWFRLLI